MSEEKKKSIFRKVFLILAICVGVITVVVSLSFFLVNHYVLKPVGLEIHPLKQAAPAEEVYNHPLLSADQEQTLYSLGVDIANIPTQITPELQKCAEETLGRERLNEIIAGASPSLADIMKAKDCL
ncbi:MAG: hypothetical protein ABII02_01525 [Candidatus Magasanikbacteria bacterium]